MSNDVLHERGLALEEQFFKHHEEELVAKLKAQREKGLAREELRALTGITDEKVLDALSGLQVGGGAAVLVMSVFPVLEVAWADGILDEQERKAILEVAASVGITDDSPARGFLTRWLEEKPELKWHALWADYTRALVAMMKPEDRALLKATVLGRATKVAEASGGFLGVAWRISDAERAVLQKLEQAFS